MKVFKSISPIVVSVILAGCASSGGGGGAQPELDANAPDGALTGYELAALFSGARTSGNSATTEGATWSQEYPEIPLTSTKGKGKGTWVPPGGAEEGYPFSFRVKGNQWCEDWGSGRSCWHIVRQDDNTIQAYKDGVANQYAWNIEPGPRRPIRQTGAQLAADNATPSVYKGNYKGTEWELHKCADGTEHLLWEGQWQSRTWSVEGDLACNRNSSRKACNMIFADPENPDVVHYVRKGDTSIRGISNRQNGESPTRCDA
jgi:hypothetical protein